MKKFFNIVGIFMVIDVKSVKNFSSAVVLSFSLRTLIIFVIFHDLALK